MRGDAEVSPRVSMRFELKDERQVHEYATSLITVDEVTPTRLTIQPPEQCQRRLLRLPKLYELATFITQIGRSKALEMNASAHQLPC